MDYAVRVSYPYAQLVEVFKKLSEVCDKIVVYEHDASRVHVHALLCGCRVSTDTIKNWIKKTLNVTVSKYDWSFKNANKDDKYITYMSKGKLEPAFSKGYDGLELASLREQWQDKKEVKEEESSVIDLRKVRVTRYTLANEVLGLYNERYTTAESYDEDERLKVKMKKLIEIVKEVCKKHKKGCDYDNCAKIAQTVLADLDPNYWIQKVFRRI